MQSPLNPSALLLPHHTRRSRITAMRLWRNSIDAVLRTTQKFYRHDILWSLVVSADPDQAFASLSDQGMLIEDIEIPAKAADDTADDAADSSSHCVSWPRQAESISRSLPGPPIRIVVISDTHSQHHRMAMVGAVLQLISCCSITV